MTAAPLQLSLLDPPLPDPARADHRLGVESLGAEPLEARLRRLGLDPRVPVHVHRNRTVMVSLSPRTGLRVHEGYSRAPDGVLRAIVRFVMPRVPRREREAARREILAFPAASHAPPPPRPPRSRGAPRPGDLRFIRRLEEAHRRLNREHFGGSLGEIPIRVSGRMRTRLGELTVELATGRALEIAISRRHLRRDPWVEVEATLLHEMVHQWQAERGMPVDHGPRFRRKAREVGIEPRAVRDLGRPPVPPSPPGGYLPVRHTEP
ncbi:MAG TPA: SprT-like domain-containing protein [Gemmatimonadales bacterium]|nr:SprT-like domain-containing protein [Gemmatimonadales bacterium]